MASIIRISAVGNLGRDPETRYTTGGAMNVTFTMAATKRKPDGTESTTWLRVTAWGKLAESLDKLTQQGALTKGSQVFAAGTFEAREYTGNDGAQRMSLDVNANDVLLLGSRADRTAGQGAHDDIPF